MLNSSVFPFFLSLFLSLFLLFYPPGRKGPINCRLIYCPVWHDAFLPLEPVFEATFPITLCLQPVLTSSEHPLLLPPSRSPPPPPHLIDDPCSFVREWRAFFTFTSSAIFLLVFICNSLLRSAGVEFRFQIKTVGNGKRDRDRYRKR